MATVETQVEFAKWAAADGLDAVPTGTPGWWGLGYLAWYRMGARVGDNRPITGVPGRLHVPREYDELRVPQRILIDGHRDREGTPYGDPLDGVTQNLLYLREHLLDYLPQRSITFHARSGTTYTGLGTIDDEWTLVEAPNSDGSHVHLDFVVVIEAGSIVTT